jgi:hypothetical protein
MTMTTRRNDMAKKDEQKLADTANDKETFYHRQNGSLSDMLIFHQLQLRQRDEEERRLFGKTKVANVVP